MKKHEKVAKKAQNAKASQSVAKNKLAAAEPVKEKVPVVNELLRVAQAGNMQTTTDTKTVAGETGAYLDSSEETHDVMKQVAAMRNLQLVCKWAGGRILKENLDSLTTAITNKKLGHRPGA